MFCNKTPEIMIRFRIRINLRVENIFNPWGTPGAPRFCRGLRWQDPKGKVTFKGHVCWGGVFRRIFVRNDQHEQIRRNMNRERRCSEFERQTSVGQTAVVLKRDRCGYPGRSPAEPNRNLEGASCHSVSPQTFRSNWSNDQTMSFDNKLWCLL